MKFLTECRRNFTDNKHYRSHLSTDLFLSTRKQLSFKEQ